MIGSCVLDCGAVCVACSGGARAVAVRASVSAVMKAGLSLSFDTDGQAVYGDSHRFSCAGQDLVRATVGRFRKRRNASCRRKTWVESARSLWIKTAGEA